MSTAPAKLEYQRQYRKRVGFKYQHAYHCTARGMASALVSKARYRARLRGYEFDIATDDVQPLLEAELARGTVTTEKNQPHTASLDKIQAERGYVVGNLRIVPWWYNAAKHDFSATQIDAAIATWASSRGN